MLKKTITYTDYDGVSRTEEFCFNLSKPDLMRLQMSTPGGYSEKLKKLLDAKDYTAMFNEFETLIVMAYGEKSEDGRRFMKSEELSKAFIQSEAYSVLFDEFMAQPEALAAFVNGLISSGSKQ